MRKTGDGHAFLQKLRKYAGDKIHREGKYSVQRIQEG
jgi:hypothetical protein